MIENSKNFPKRYFARHIKEGLVHYLENGKDKLYLVTNEALHKMNSSFEGKPIYIRHVDEVDTDKMKEEAVGYVVKSFYNEFDGAWWAEIIADDEAQGYIEKGWAVSNAYLPTELGSGGVYHDIDYDKEVKSGVYEHLAIVDNPRYEEAVIMTPEEFKDFNEGRKTELDKLKNSKENEMLSEEDKKELLDSLKNSLSEIVKDTVKNAMEEKDAEDKKNAEDEDHRQLIREIAAISAKGESDFEGGLEEKVKTIIGLAEKLGYSKDEAKHNAEDEEDKKEDEKEDEESEDKKDNESEEDSEKENKCNEDEDKEKEEKKENSKFFSFLHNAKTNSDKSKTIATMATGLALGRERYGSK
jgi:hypothetical protein